MYYKILLIFFIKNKKPSARAFGEKEHKEFLISPPVIIWAKPSNTLILKENFFNSKKFKFHNF